MRTILTPFTFLVSVLASRLNDWQQSAVEFLRGENRVRRQQLGKRWLRLTADERRRLAAKEHKLGRKLHSEMATRRVTSSPTGSRLGQQAEAMHDFELAAPQLDAVVNTSPCLRRFAGEARAELAKRGK